jgi:predicted small lipoprotein YifL
MRSLLRSFLTFFTLGAALTGCGKQEPAVPPGPTDVTLLVPGMN